MSGVERISFAERCETTAGHLRNIVYGDRSCSAELAVNFERESDGAVTCETLCPDVDWKYLRGSTRDPSGSTKRKCG